MAARLMAAGATLALLSGCAADLIIHNARVLTVDSRFRIVDAVAVRDGRIVAIGSKEEVLFWAGPGTRVIDGKGATVMPGIYDSHVHPPGAAVSEVEAPLPLLRSIPEVLAHVRKQAAKIPAGGWIVVRYAFPTRLKEARFPTLTELDVVAPRHPVLFHAGPAGIVNTAALKHSGITRETPDPAGGSIVRDGAGEPTGMLRNAYGVLKGVPSSGGKLEPESRRDLVKWLFWLYNQQGITSVADRSADRGSLDLYLALRKTDELTLRVNVARSFNPRGTPEEIAARLDDLPGPDGRGGPTGAGDSWVRIGPIKLFLDGGMLNGSAYMRDPWPPGPAYQVTTEDYRGLLFIPPAPLRTVLESAARRGWQMTAHTAGEGAMDELLDAYVDVNSRVPIRDLRFCITHANFPSLRNLEICRRLNVVADVQPAWLWKDGGALTDMLGEPRMKWFQPYRSWMQWTTIGGGSDHMIRTDPLESTNPWSPWLGMWVAITRRTERGGVHNPDERLSREQAVRLYTINNAYLHKEEGEKGSLEPGKLADLILLDRNIMTCPEDDIRTTRVLLTVVGGRVVHDMVR